jgi:uncharacterized protein (DUF2235 family)
MGKVITLCLDGTNNQVRSSANTNVVRLYDMLDLSDASNHVAYYAPGVGTFSSSAAWTPPARTVSRYMGLMFGAGLRQELGNAYQFLMNAYEPGDRVFVFGFSRGAYTARALLGLVDAVGLFRPGAENLVPYVVSVFANDRKNNQAGTLANYTSSFARVTGGSTRITIDFVGLWDTVEAAGTLSGGPLRWPGTDSLSRARVVRHATSIDERRRPFALSPVVPLDPAPPATVDSQDLLQVWFAGVHSDVGGMFDKGARLSDIPLKWMVKEACAHGLAPVVARTYDTYLTQVTGECATGAVHVMSRWWGVLGRRRRRVPSRAFVHASVRTRIAADSGYRGRTRIPDDVQFVDDDWLPAAAPQTPAP